MRTTTLQMTGDPFLVRALDGTVSVSIPIKIRRYSGRCQVVVPQGIAATPIDNAAPTALQTALARGHRWLRLIESGKIANLAAIAKMEKFDPSYVSRMVNLTTLAPDLVAAILDDALPDHLTLFDIAVDPPALWEEQRQRVGHPDSMRQANIPDTQNFPYGRRLCSAMESSA
jgi:hypothetical protein